MSNTPIELLESGILFPRWLSDRIIATLMSQTEVPWSAVESILDEIIPRIVSFGYTHVPGIRSRLDDAEVDPHSIADFESYDKLFPLISLPEMADIGLEQFQLQDRGDSPRSRHSDFDVASTYVLEYVSEVGRKKKRRVLRVDATKADARAACLALAGQLLREDKLPRRILVNQRQGDYLGRDFLTEIVIPALELAGTQTERVLEDGERLTGDGDTGILMPGATRQVLDFRDTSGFGLVISADGRYYIGKTFHVGDISAIYGVFPNLGYRMPLPILVRIVGADGAIPRDDVGKPNTNKRGRIVVDRFFSAYEFPTPWKLLVNGLIQVLDYIELIGLTSLDVKVLEAFWGSDGDYSFRDEFHLAAMEAGLRDRDDITVEDICQLYSVALQHYSRRSVRMGMPSSSWLLKVGFPFAAQMDSNGVVNSAINVSLGTPTAYIAGEDLPIKYTPEETPYICHNIIGTVSEGQAHFPQLMSSAVRKRIKDVLNGRNLFGAGNDGYLYSTPVIAPGDFESMQRAAEAYTLLAESSPDPRICLEEIVDILSRLHALVEAELEATYDGKRSMVSAFAEKTRIPLSEIAGMVMKAKVDFADCEGTGLKRTAYAAFVDPFANMEQLPNRTLERGIDTLMQKKPFSPVFMVTPGNINLYDSFYIMAHILLAKLCDQRDKCFIMYIRPSESDITFNFLVYHFHKMAKELDPDNKKGLRALLQKAYWDPRYDEDFLRRAMAKAEAGIYYGTAKTYMEARFRAALDVAVAKGFSSADTQRLLEIAGRRQSEYRPITLEYALEEGIDPDLVHEVGVFTSRHKIYPETLNAIAILPDAGQLDLQKCAESIVEQTISLRAADCTNANKLWIHRSVYDEFMETFEEAAGNLTYGDIMNPKVRLAQYDTHYLKGTQGIVRSSDDTKIIAPTDVATGERSSEIISPEKNYTGVIVTEIEAKALIGGDPVDRDVYLTHLSKEVPIPWLNVILYDDVEQVLHSMKDVLEKYTQRSGYPRYLYVSAMGTESVDAFEKAISENDMTDLFKKGDEAYSQFLYYRPHQGSFFINELVR